MRQGGESSPYLCLEVVDGQVRAKGQVQYAAGQRLNGDGLDEGVYCAWEWDGMSLQVETCRFGLYPLFYLEAPALFCISDSLAELLRYTSPRRLTTTPSPCSCASGSFSKTTRRFATSK